VRFLEIGGAVVKSWLSRPDVGETYDKEITPKTAGLFVMFGGIVNHRVGCKLIQFWSSLLFKNRFAEFLEGSKSYFVNCE
jgi:hypothetical protein